MHPWDAPVAMVNSLGAVLSLSHWWHNQGPFNTCLLLLPSSTKHPEEAFPYCFYMFLLVDSGNPWWPGANRQAPPVRWLRTSFSQWFKSGKPWWPPGFNRWLRTSLSQFIGFSATGSCEQRCWWCGEPSACRTSFLACALAWTAPAGPEPCAMAIAIDELSKQC